MESRHLITKKLQEIENSLRVNIDPGEILQLQKDLHKLVAAFDEEVDKQVQISMQEKFQAKYDYHLSIDEQTLEERLSNYRGLSTFERRRWKKFRKDMIGVVRMVKNGKKVPCPECQSPLIVDQYKSYCIKCQITINKNDQKET